MKQFVAIMVVVVVGLAGIWLWQSGLGQSGSGNGSGNTPKANLPQGNGLEYESKPLEDLPEYDPDYLWPLNGKRMAAPVFPVIWETEEFSACRLLVKTGPKVWANVGNSAGRRHALWVDLSKFQSTATFCVEFEHGSDKYRSKPRTVKFGAGVSFKQREFSFDLQEIGRQEFTLGLAGRRIDRLNIENFQHARFDESVKLAHKQPDGDKLTIILYNPEAFSESSYGFFEVHDAVSDTVDRCIVRFKKN
ncbi:MAG: hypothetical protein ACYTDT_01605 [Planctomycetota bacterium]|jgi:hypothetical protein